MKENGHADDQMYSYMKLNGQLIKIINDVQMKLNDHADCQRCFRETKQSC